MSKKNTKRLLKKVWHFIWDDNSVWSWIVNIVLAFVLIKFIVYPVLGYVLSTTHPVVAVVSSSMEHRTVRSCAVSNPTELFNVDSSSCDNYRYTMCGNAYKIEKSFNLQGYWNECGKWYKNNHGIAEERFSSFPFKNGFNKGDIMVLKGMKADKINIGDVIVFFSNKRDPIIHRVVKKNEKDGKVYFQTKGDNNEDSIRSTMLDETNVSQEVIIGKAVLRVPFLGYIKIWFVQAFKMLNII